MPLSPIVVAGGDFSIIAVLVVVNGAINAAAVVVGCAGGLYCCCDCLCCRYQCTLIIRGFGVQFPSRANRYSMHIVHNFAC